MSSGVEVRYPSGDTLYLSQSAHDITFDLGTLNAHLVYYGYAHAKDYAPDTKYSETLHSLETAMPSSGSSMPIGPLKKGA